MAFDPDRFVDRMLDADDGTWHGIQALDAWHGTTLAMRRTLSDGTVTIRILSGASIAFIHVDAASFFRQVSALAATDDPAQRAAMVACFRSFFDVAGKSPALHGAITPIFGERRSDLIHRYGPGAIKALEIGHAECVPGDAIKALVASLADEPDVIINWCHGWPILSCGGETSHDSRAGGAAPSALHPRSLALKAASDEA
jgi:hypothetical protein